MIIIRVKVIEDVLTLLIMPSCLFHSFIFQAETATDLIAIDRFATSYPNEKIILSSDLHEYNIEAKSNLHYIIKQHLQETLDWFNDCQVK